jgi:hypothetical protein
VFEGHFNHGLVHPIFRLYHDWEFVKCDLIIKFYHYYENRFIKNHILGMVLRVIEAFIIIERVDLLVL